MSFSGFPDGTFAFLRGIEKNNSKAWLDAHRDGYDAFYVTPARDFVTALGPKLKKISKTVSFEPKVNGSLFRIQRDVRFSKDKTPYKTHLDLWFWEGKKRGWDAPGFFFRMFHDRLMIGGGMHRFEKTQLDKFRLAVLDTKRAKDLDAAIAKVTRAGDYDIGGATRTKVPRGFDGSHPRAPYLLHEGLFAGVETKIPREARSAKFVDWCAAHFANVAPLNAWLLCLQP